MSTFIFAPSWADYSNRPKNIDEFPTLIQNNSKQSYQQNNTWSSSYLLQKIQRPEDIEDIKQDELKEDKKTELERLKALVPKRINHSKSNVIANRPMKTRLYASLACTSNNINNSQNKSSNSSCSSSSSNSSTSSSSSSSSSSSNINNRNNNNNSSNNNNNSSSSSKSNNNGRTFKVTTPKLAHCQYISEEDKQKFLMFIKSWTSSGITNINHHHQEHNQHRHSHNTRNVIGYHKQQQTLNFTHYSYFGTFDTLNNKTHNHISYFYYNHFPTSP
ncbi:unnamed protein product [Rhizopus microsporus]